MAFLRKAVTGMRTKSRDEGDEEEEDYHLENGQTTMAIGGNGGLSNSDGAIRKKSLSGTSLPPVVTLGKSKNKFPSLTKSLMRSFSSKHVPLDQVDNKLNLTKSNQDNSTTAGSLDLDNDMDFDDSGLDYSPFVELLMKSDHSILFSICTALLNSDEATVVAPHLIQLIDTNKQALPIFQRVIQIEIEKTKDEGTLLRNTCVATLLMSAYGRLVGELYLSQMLKPLVFDFPRSQSFEIDPNRITKGTAEDNLQNLLMLTKKFIDQIVSSLDLCPKSLRLLCSLLQIEVSKKFPQSRLSSVGGFFFLRFICPAIVAPETFGIITDGIDSTVRRTLVLVSKILQSLTNGVPFGEKEAYMIPLNGFIEENTGRIQEFFDSLTSMDIGEATPRDDVAIIERRSMKFIFTYVRSNLRVIHDILSVSPMTQSLDYDPYRELQKIVTSLKKSSRNTIEVGSKKMTDSIGRASKSGPLYAGDRRSVLI